MSQCISCVVQDNPSFSVVQRRRKAGHAPSQNPRHQQSAVTPLLSYMTPKSRSCHQRPSRTSLKKSPLQELYPISQTVKLPFPVPMSTGHYYNSRTLPSQAPVPSRKPPTPPVYPPRLPLQTNCSACGLSLPAPRRRERRRKPRPCRLLGAGSRKSRLLCSRRRRRCRCCCGWCSELRGSESRLSPFPAAAMKWMFKEDHSLGECRATGRAVGAGAAGGPLPHLGRSGLGRAGRMPLFGLASPSPCPQTGSPRTPCRLREAFPGARGPRIETAVTLE